MFKESSEIVRNTFKEYKGSGMYVALFFVSILYIFLNEKDKKKRCLFGYFPLLCLLVTLNPLVCVILNPIFTASIYWRLFWVLPTTITIAYVCVDIIKKESKTSKQLLTAFAIAVIIGACGMRVYKTGFFTKVGNLYRLPDESVLIAQLIGIDEEEYKKALVPEYMLAHIRQIDATINLMYRRDPTGKYEDNVVRMYLNSGNVKGIHTACISTDTNYVVIPKQTVLSEEMEDYGFKKINESVNHNIYKLVDKNKEPEENLKDKKDK